MVIRPCMETRRTRRMRAWQRCDGRVFCTFTTTPPVLVDPAPGRATGLMRASREDCQRKWTYGPGKAGTFWPSPQEPAADVLARVSTRPA